MGYYYATARGTMEILRPEGHIIQLKSKGCILPTEGCRRPKEVNLGPVEHFLSPPSAALKVLHIPPSLPPSLPATRRPRLAEQSRVLDWRATGRSRRVTTGRSPI